ncbi:hypothetical protein DPMN_076636 [Dreissena polymorpha]|uniref:Uncharacterized protein n=1 Tax=Dreissena polymorpha TaxID=45954 RepID=A0A9D3YKG4_DREPO|nr:hypothetical protein DPMN_076636 [Dreissena polymorpha]
MCSGLLIVNEAEEDNFVLVISSEGERTDVAMQKALTIMLSMLGSPKPSVRRS